MPLSAPFGFLRALSCPRRIAAVPALTAWNANALFICFQSHEVASTRFERDFGNSLISDGSANFVPTVAFDCASKLHHTTGSGPSSFENVPVGPFPSRSARRTGSRSSMAARPALWIVFTEDVA